LSGDPLFSIKVAEGRSMAEIEGGVENRLLQPRKVDRGVILQSALGVLRQVLRTPGLPVEAVSLPILGQG